MVEYLKDRNIVFKLKDLNEYLEQNIWKAYQVREEILDSNGQIIRFPLTDDNVFIKGLDGVSRNRREMLMLPNSVFRSNYPMLSINRVFLRAIYVGKNEYWYRFKYSANKKLKELIEQIVALNQNPLKITYQQIYNPQASPIEMYSITIFKEKTNNGEVSNVKPEPTTKPKPVQNLNIPTVKAKIANPKPKTPLTKTSIKKAIALNNKLIPGKNFSEKQLYEALLKVKGVMSEEKFIENLKTNGVQLSRAKQIYVQYLADKE